MCAKQEVVDKKVCPGLDDDQSLYDENCNLIEPDKKNDKVDYSTGESGVTGYAGSNPGSSGTSSVPSNVTSSVDNSNVKIETIDGVTYANGILVVNKTYGLPSNYQPAGSSGKSVCESCLTAETMAAFEEMKSDAKAVNIGFYIGSGYRSYSYQDGLYKRRVNRDGRDSADKSTARPGHSEHQTGLAFDVCSNNVDSSKCINSGFDNTEPAKWLSQNCYKYGLIIRYPNGKTNYTGYKYESWHLRYVGKELAEKLYNNGSWISLEEYFGLTSSYE